jgi:hypothetical protein
LREVQDYPSCPSSPIPIEHRFTLPGLTLSQNELDGKHWSVKHAQQVYWHQIVAVVARRCPHEPRRASVSVVRVSKRLIDPLNVYAGLKWLLDAFVEQGWLTGDGYNDLVISADQRKCRKSEEPCMEVTIRYP